MIQGVSIRLGSFTASLDDADFFGAALRFDDVFLFVGAYYDDDGGANRGAVYALSLTPSAQVASFMKISSINAQFTAHLYDTDLFGTSVAAFPTHGVESTLIVGACTDDGGQDKGAVFVIYLNLVGGGRISSFFKISNASADFTAALQSQDNFGMFIFLPTISCLNAHEL